MGEPCLWKKTDATGRISARLAGPSRLLECDWLNCDWPTSSSCGWVCNNTDYDSSFAKVEKKMPSSGFLWWFLNILKILLKM